MFEWLILLYFPNFFFDSVKNNIYKTLLDKEMDDGGNRQQEFF